MRLNPLHPSDNPMYQQLYCFGSGGNTSGGSASDFDDSYNQAMGYTDTVGGRGRSDASGNARQTTAEERAAAPGYDSKVQDAIDRGEDLTTDRAFDIAAAAVGGGRAGQTDAERASISEAEVAAARAGVPSDVFVTSAGGKIVRSGDGTPVTSGRSVEEAAKAAGTDTSSVMDAIKAAAGTDFGEGFGTAPGPGTSAQGPQGTAITQAALEPAKVEAARQVTPGLTPEVAQIASGILDQAVPGRVAEGVRADPVMGGSLFMDDIDVFAPEVTSVNAPPSAIDPSRPMVSIRGATPAEQITAEARAAANQLFGEDRTRPTADQLAAANARFGPTGMQPTTTEVDAYNQAINQQIADQLGISSYSPATYNPNAAPGPLSQVSTGPITQQDYDNLAAGRGVMQGGIASVNQMVDQALREVELETGVPASQLSGIMASGAQQRATANRDQMAAEMAADQRLTGASGTATDILSGYDQALASFTSAPGPIGMDQVRADEIDLERQQYEDYINTGQVGRELAPNEVVSFTDFEGRELSSFKPAQTAEERANQIANFALNKDPRIASAAQQALANTTGTADQGTPERGPGVAPTRANLNDIDRSLTEEEAFRAAQQTEPEPGAADLREALGRQDIFASPLGFDETDLATMPDESVGIRGIRADNLERAAQAQRAIDFEPNPMTPGATMVLGAINAVDSLLGGNQAQKITDVAAREGGQFVNLPGADNVRVGAIGPSLNPFSNDLVYVGDPAGFAEAKKIADEKGLNLTTGAGTQDPISGMREGDPGVDYSRQGLMDTDDGGDGGTLPILPPIEEAPEDVPPEEYKGRDVVKPYQYQARGPLTYAYTGLPSLAPTRLRPTYTARKTFSPLFPVS
jgi:hypothetical protein